MKPFNSAIRFMFLNLKNIYNEKCPIPENKLTLISEMVEALVKIEGIEAIALGGSFGAGLAIESSDIDLVICYSEKAPFKIEELEKLAKKFAREYFCSDFYQGGNWLNGFTILDTQIGKVDWLYHNIEQCQRVILESKEGKYEWDFKELAPFGYFSIMYLAHLENSIAIYDPKEIIKSMQKEIEIYPEVLKKI